MEKEKLQMSYASLDALVEWLIDAIELLPFSEASKPAVDTLLAVRKEKHQCIEIVS